jgi:hypothetical protein
MGRLFFMMKRWWLIAIVFTLALSLTSCANKPGNGTNFGYVACDSEVLGQFDVYTIASGSSGGQYSVVVVPYQVFTQGVSYTIGLENIYTGFPALSDITPVQDQEILVRELTAAELQNYTHIRIGPYQASIPYLQGAPDNDLVCELPLPGNIQGQTN